MVHHYTLFMLQAAPRSMSCPARASVLLRSQTLSSKSSTKIRVRAKKSTWQRRFSRHENLTMSGKVHILSKCAEVVHARIVPTIERQRWRGRSAQEFRAWGPPESDVTHPFVLAGRVSCHEVSSQRSLHNAPIFRLLLKVAVNGTHQCDYANFCGNLGSQRLGATCMSSAASNRPCQWIPDHTCAERQQQPRMRNV